MAPSARTPIVLKQLRKQLLFKAFISRGHILNLAARKRDLLETIALLRPIDCGHDLIRLGSPRDGGYLVPNDLEKISACFSPGVAKSSAFEDALAADYGIRSFLADYSVAGPATPNEKFDFERKFLGALNDDVFMRLEDWVNSKLGAGATDDLILQMDIESSEFDVLIDTPSDVLRKFRIMVIEFHDMEMLLDRRALRMSRAIFQKIKNDFCVAHIHPNNSNMLFKYGEISIPSAIEVTFLRRDRVKPGNRRLQFPHPLDRRNIKSKKDMVLPKVWRGQAS